MTRPTEDCHPEERPSAVKADATKDLNGLYLAKADIFPSYSIPSSRA
jgi:hypothetical protein